MSESHNNEAARVAQLREWEGRWETEMGGWFPGERVIVRGKNIFTECRDMDYISFLVFALTGEIPTPAQGKILNAMWLMGSSFPDPRLWNNRVSALAAAARSTTGLGVGAGTAATEALVYGQRPIIGILVMLQEVQAQLDKGVSLKDALQARLNMATAGSSAAGKNRQLAKLPGYGRPLTNKDERNAPILALNESLGFGDRTYVKLIHAIENTLRQELDLNWSVNAAAVVCAIFLDQGLSTRQSYYYTTLAFSGGMLFCQADAEHHAEGSFFPLSCEKIIYKGPARREWKSD